jgi:hypothetical protein
MFPDRRDPKLVRSLIDKFRTRLSRSSAAAKKPTTSINGGPIQHLKLALGRLPDTGPDPCSQQPLSRPEAASHSRDVIRLIYTFAGASMDGYVIVSGRL